MPILLDFMRFFKDLDAPDEQDVSVLHIGKLLNDCV